MQDPSLNVPQTEPVSQEEQQPPVDELQQPPTEAPQEEKQPPAKMHGSYQDQGQNEDLDRIFKGRESLKKKLYECNGTACPKSIKQYEGYIKTKLGILRGRAKGNEGVGLLFGLPTIEKEGKKIKGVLAYAGVSLNNRIYLPEELAKGDGLTLPLLLNHSNVAGAEEELDRLESDMRSALETNEDFEVGEVTLRWEPEELTLYYEGVISHPFFQKEVDDADMAVSLGIYYDSDSPEVCNQECYTLIKGAEFREVSLVYHPGFPIATIEAVEVRLKNNANNAISNESKNMPHSFSISGVESMALSTDGGHTANFNLDGSGGNTIFLSVSGIEAQLQPYFSLPKALKDQMKVPPNPRIYAPEDTMKEKEQAEEDSKKKLKNSKKKNTHETKKGNLRTKA